MPKKNKTLRNYVAAPLVLVAYFAAVIVVELLRGGGLMNVLNFVYIAFFVALAMVLFAVLPRPRKRAARVFALFMVGGALFVGAGVMGRVDMQLEGFFFYLFAGVAAGTVIHYVVAKIVGPLVIGRGWCGWGCWTAFVLDLLPYKRSPGRAPGRGGWLRYAHFAFSLALVAVLFFGFKYTIFRRQWDVAGLYWFLGGNVLYYGAAVALAVGMKDNRAFCKYLCPIVSFLKPAASVSLLKIRGDADYCEDCGACAKACPMDIEIPSYTKEGKRVLANECMICMTCVDTCPNGALAASVGLDAGGRSRLRVRGA